MLEKISVDHLCVGLFVAELDRPWLDTPFLLQGFLIDSEEILAELRLYCEHVLVDPERSVAWDRIRHDPAQQTARRLMALLDGPASAETDLPDLPQLLLDAPGGAFGAGIGRYADQTPIDDEMPLAQVSYAQAESAIKVLFDDLRQQGRIDLEHAAEVVTGMVESVIRNPDALALLSRVKHASDYVYRRSISVAINLLVFGRHLGFPRDHLHTLGAAGLLLDVGASRLPPHLLDKPGKLTAAEFATVKQHVAMGLDLLRDSPGVSARVLAIVAGHHEREDGSGYPQALSGQAISVPAKMAAIVDCYDALTTDRPYARSYSPYEALQHLYQWRDKLFQGELVEQFIQSLGIYPVGSLVELNSGEVAVVLAHSRTRRLKPRLLVILDAGKQAYRAPVSLDLLSAPRLPDGRVYEIQRPLENGAHGIDPRDYYL